MWSILPTFKVALVVLLLLPLESPNNVKPELHPGASQTTFRVIQSALKPIKQPNFPDFTSNYQNTVAIPAEQAAEQAAAQAAAEAAQAVPDAQPASYAPAPQADALTGSEGYSLSGGNCVDMAIAYGKDQPGNPISWVPSTMVPFIGAAALFPFNHVGVVVGIWNNGDVEIAQENAPGMAHRFPPSEFRGFF